MLCSARRCLCAIVIKRCTIYGQKSIQSEEELAEGLAAEEWISALGTIEGPALIKRRGDRCDFTSNQIMASHVEFHHAFLFPS